MGHLTYAAAEHDQQISTTVYGSSYAAEPLPRNTMPENEMPARTAARFITDELMMDGNPALNLASFVTTTAEPEVEALMMKNMNKNFIDVEEYPACGELESRCVHMISDLFNAPKEPGAMGVSTIGSSEAIILAVLAAKRRWQNKRKAEGKSIDRPNIVMNAAVQVCWEKAARYLEVEEKYWYCKENQFIYDPQELVDLVDENTILVCSILGTTYTGQYEDTATLNDLLMEKNKKEGLDVWIHVDAASGGFVAPFVNPSLLWDFRLPLVCSINTSGHKYGLALAGVGWAVWRNKSFLPDEILFTVNYLGAPQVSFTLNFSKSAVQVINQYYNMIRFGRCGYRAIMANLTATADYLAEEVVKFTNADGSKKFVIMSDGEGTGLPLVAWRLAAKEHYDEFVIARTLRNRGWIVPAYSMAPNASETKLLRVVVREDFSRTRCDTFLRDLKDAMDFCDKLPKAAVEAIKDANGTHPSSGHRGKTRRDRHGHETTHHGKLVIREQHSLSGKHGKSHAVC